MNLKGLDANKMFLGLKHISNQKKSILLVVLILCIAITFETFQQLYYINRYDIAKGVSFFDLLKTQTKSWIVWFVLAIPLIKVAKFSALKEHITIVTFTKLFLTVLGLVSICIILISVIQLANSSFTFSLHNLVFEFVPFYTFQKSLIFTLGYIAISIILHFYFKNEQLLIKIEELSELKKSHAELYTKLKAELDDKTKILNIKIGNKRKIIPVDHIYWIESDDYCVKVHTEKDTYTMRSSLKALEEQLEHNFLRVHRKAIVNMDSVKEFNSSNPPTLTLNNQTKVSISKSKLKLVKDFIS